MKTLTKKVNNATITLAHVEGNTYRLTIDGGTFTKGKSGYYSDGSEVATPMLIDNNTLLITKAEMSRLETFVVYINDKKDQLQIDGKWINEKGVQIVIMDPATDLYYYFRRPDCGIVQTHYAKGTGKESEIAYTVFHKKIGGENVIEK